MADAALYAGLVALAVVPPILFLVWVRFTEHHQREPYRWLAWAFVYGGTFGVIIAFALNTLGSTAAAALTNDATGYKLMVFLVVAPFVEELTKGLGLGTVRRPMREFEDGIIYGAAIGLGFAAAENLLYGFTVLADEGTTASLTVLAIRALSTTLLHMGTTALLGFAFGLAVMRHGVSWQLLPVYLLVVAIHAAYNALVAFTFGWVGLLLAVALVWVMFGWLRNRISQLDALPHETT